MFNFSYCEFSSVTLKKKKRKNLYRLVKKKISYGKVLKDSFLRWMEFKNFVIYLNVYF